MRFHERAALPNPHRGDSAIVMADYGSIGPGTSNPQEGKTCSSKAPGGCSLWLSMRRKPRSKWACARPCFACQLALSEGAWALR